MNVWRSIASRMWLPVLMLIAPAALAQQEAEFMPGVVVVQFEPDVVISGGAAKTGAVAFDAAASAFGVTSVERPFAFLDHVEPTPKTDRNLAALRRTYYVRYSADENPLHVAKALAAAAGVAYAEPVLFHHYQAPLVLPNDSLFSDQAYLRQVRLPEAWDVVKGEDGNPPVVIAIVDGGGDWRHADLRANVWTNADETPGNGIDDDNNGFIDDVHGANFANDDARNNDPTGLPETPRSAWHGTAVAGVAGAVTDNTTGISGAAWNANIMHVNASCRNRDSVCHGYEGILYAAANAADIVNVSWSAWPGDQELQMATQALDLATDLGALVVTSAGNSNWSVDVIPIYPAIHPRVLSVGATARDSRTKASFSNYGKRLSVLAPGEGIVTTAPDGEYSHSALGTSLSAPLVSGVAALVKTRFPNLSPDGLREQVRLASENVDAENSEYAGRLGRGLVNAEAALQTPSLPGVRLQRWALTDPDGNGHIAPGEEVTIRATLVNHLADARQLTVGLAAFESYPYLDLAAAEHTISSLPGGDSAEVALRFTVAPDAPVNRRVRFYLRIRDGSFVDEVDQITLGINRDLNALHGALTALYVATGGNNWRNNAGWNTSTTPTLEELARWFGLTMRQGWLVGLDLQFNELSGTLPAELGNLSSLLWISMGSNSLSGTIASELGQLSQLRELRLDNNDLSGPIPNQLGNLTQLTELRLHKNALSGQIPQELGNLSSLQSLLLNHNVLTGEIPGQLGNLKQLQLLYLSGNELSGPIPSELGNLAQLTVLSLHENLLSGSIPAELGSLEQVRWLWLSKNTLSGTIPAELGNLSRMHWLSLWQNNLSGPIPEEFGNLSELRWLRLYDNALSGEIPSELGNLSRLVELSLWRNNLSGPIPTELGNLDRLTRLDLADNALSGIIPAQLGNLRQLQRLALPNNLLSGEVPRELARLEQLEVLLLHGNSLSGDIPDELGNLPQLGFLSLNGNELTGSIPWELGNLAELHALWLAGNALSGPIPTELGNLPKLGQLWLAHNALSGPVPAELGNLAQLRELMLEENELSGPVPAELGNLAQLQRLQLSGNQLTGRLPRSLMQLTNLERLIFEGQALCAPQDAAFQAWLTGIRSVRGPTCVGTYLSGDIAKQLFTRGTAIAAVVLPEADGGAAPYAYTVEPALPPGLAFDEGTRTIRGTPAAVTLERAYTYTASDTTGSAASLTFTIEVVAAVAFQDLIADQSFPRAQPITPLVLPAASGGVATLEYRLTPALPAGLDFDPATRILTGTPTDVTAESVTYTYKATDANGSSDSLLFGIEVYSPVAAERESLPGSFAVRGNYPNPFRQSTRLVFDLPWPARVRVEVMDLTGRRVHVVPPAAFAAGWEQGIEISGAALSSGLYLYRLSTASPEGGSVHMGFFIRLR